MITTQQQLFGHGIDGYVMAALVNSAAWDIAQSRKKYMPNCNNIAVGGTFRKVTGAMPYWRDHSQLCTSFVQDVMSIAFLNLAASSTLEDLFQQNIYANSDLDCPSSSPRSPDLKVIDLAGVFVIYAIIMVITIVVGIIDKF
jgi:hypothetical protein